jgi:hypothetical protein
MLHRTRYTVIRKQTAVINPMRAHLMQFGIAVTAALFIAVMVIWREQSRPGRGIAIAS